MEPNLCRRWPSLFAVACLLLIGQASFAQDWTNEGSITSRQYRNRIREGNRIVATDFFTLQYSVQSRLVEGGQGGPNMTCTNRCKGKVHPKHESCDYSCDVRCTERHRTTVRGNYTPDRAAMRAAVRAANALARSGGGSASPSDWSSRVSRSLANLRREARKRKTFNMPHADPCSGRNWWVGTKIFSFQIIGTMRKVGYRMRSGVRTPINEVVGTHTQTVAQAEIAQEEPLRKHTWEACKCGTPPPIDYNQMMEDLDKIIKGLDLDAATTGPEGITMIATDGEVVDPGESKITVKPTDMNVCAVEIENGTGRDVTVKIPAGTIFRSGNSSVQNMGSLVPSEGMLYAGQKLTLYVSLAPVVQQRATTADFPVRWACLQIGKKEPKAGDRFTILPADDDILNRLAGITTRSRFRGPHDQARVWIYTDKATYDEVNKRMSPGVSPGRYSTLLWEVATVGGVDLTEGDYKKCLDPKLLNGIPINDAATAWLVEALTETKARDLARYVESKSKDLAAMLKSTPEFAPNHLATMVTAMLDSDNSQVERAAVRFLQRVPEESREALSASGALTGITRRLSSENSKTVEEAVNLLMDYPAEYSDEILGAFWESLPEGRQKESVRKRLGIVIEDGDGS